MDERQVRLVTGCLLHDIGKIVYRGGDGRNHSQGGYEYLKTDARITDREILDCVRYHHGIFLRNADVPLDSLAYVTYFADNIAAAADRREGENPESGFDISVPLASVFNILNGNRGEMHYSRQVLDPSGTINSPTVEKTPLDVGFYKKIISDITDNLKGIRLDEDYLNSLLTIMEANTSYIPSSTSRRELADISLYDHVKMTAAIGQCVEAVLKEKGIKDYRETLLKNAVESYREKWFLLYSIDISGIQKFIYSIGSEGALKGLRARSFYLEFIMEHMIDMLLDRLSLSRANLIYAGGGHCYLLLPNTKEVKDEALQWQKENNRWFMKHFDTDLYMAAGSVECSAMELQNEPAGSYSKLFRTISEKISAQKAHRYNAEDLKNLNHRIHHGDRECRICRRMEMLDENRRCRICAALEASSGNVLYSSYFVVSEVSNGRDLPLPGGCYLKAMGKEDLKAFMSDPSYVRCYTKNEMYTGLHVTTKLLVGSYTTGKTFEELAQDIVGMTYASYFLELADYYAREGVDGTDMINLLFLTLKALLKEQIDNELIRTIYELRLMGISEKDFQESKVSIVPLMNDGTEGSNGTNGVFGGWFNEDGEPGSYAEGHVYIEVFDDLWNWNCGLYQQNCYDEGHTVRMQYQYPVGGVLKKVNVEVRFTIEWGGGWW